MVRTPCFPTEVWLSIFDWATFVPFALDTRAPDPFGYPATPFHEDIQKRIQESMYTKRHLVLICRQWRDLATRFLYQAIVITRLETVEKLLCAVCSESIRKGVVDCPPPARPNGHWIKRIDILLPVEKCFTKDIFTRLLGDTPNVQILVVVPVCTNPCPRNYFGDVLALFDALAAKLAPSLRVLHIISDSLNDHYGSRGLPIPKAINGRSLRVFTLLSEDWEESLEEMMLDLPNVEHLDLPSKWTETLLAALEVPSSLVSLSLVNKYAPTKRLAEGRLSIARNSLDTLSIDDHVPSPYWTDSIDRPMHRVTVAFPNLRCLVVHVKSPAFAEYLPPVKKLGLYVALHWFIWSSDELLKGWETLCATIERLVAVTPTVEVARLFH